MQPAALRSGKVTWHSPIPVGLHPTVRMANSPGTTRTVCERFTLTSMCRRRMGRELMARNAHLAILAGLIVRPW